MASIVVASPLTGWCMPLAEVPDAVFAQGMAGDGLAIDPTDGVLLAPCDGEVVAMRDARHAVTVRSAGGIEILVHVGIDTVSLRGAGFQRLVAEGAAVRQGDALLRFDLDFVARHAASLASPVVLAHAGRVLRRAAPGRIAAGAFLLEVEAAGAAAIEASDALEQRQTRALRVPFEHGLHARPAAQVAAALRPYRSNVRLSLHGHEANARSTVAMMALGVRCGDEILATAIGEDAAAALEALAGLFGAAGGQTSTTPQMGVDSKSRAASTEPHVVSAPMPPARIEAIIASRGLAVGVCVHAEPAEIAIEERGRGTTVESTALSAALETVVAHLQGLRLASRGDAHALLAAHIELARDPELAERAGQHIARGHSAGHAWREATRATQAVLASLDDERMRARAADLRDLEEQVLRVLAGEAPQASREFPPDSIVVARDILPSQFLALERAHVAGIVTAHGGATSHMAILAAAAELPALVAAGEAVLAIREGTRLVLDAERGIVLVDPAPDEWAAVERALAERRTRHASDRAAARDPAVTRDGTRVAVHANLGSAADAPAAVEHGAEGCGLLRTEFLFLDRADAPGEDEQAHEYQRIADALGNRPLTIRTMDVGGDKPIAYMPLAREENPALGMRGVRAGLVYPELLRTQLRAILRVRSAGSVRILLPMVTDVADVRFVRSLVDEARRELGIAQAPALGAMIETPASALIAEALAGECDFLSLGTNDLAQYTLAIDRAHPRLAARLDPVHPAVLQLIAAVAQAAAARGRSASMCGALASDVDAAPLLVGLGIHELSATASAIPALKRAVRDSDARACRELARRALAGSSAGEVRELLAEARTPHALASTYAGG